MLNMSHRLLLLALRHDLWVLVHLENVLAARRDAGEGAHHPALLAALQPLHSIGIALDGHLGESAAVWRDDLALASPERRVPLAPEERPDAVLVVHCLEVEHAVHHVELVEVVVEALRGAAIFATVDEAQALLLRALKERPFAEIAEGLLWEPELTCTSRGLRTVRAGYAYLPPVYCT